MATRLGARAIANNTVTKAAIQDNAVDQNKIDSTDAEVQRPRRRARVLAAQSFG